MLHTRKNSLWGGSLKEARPGPALHRVSGPMSVEVEDEDDLAAMGFAPPAQKDAVSEDIPVQEAEPAAVAAPAPVEPVEQPIEPSSDPPAAPAEAPRAEAAVVAAVPAEEAYTTPASASEIVVDVEPSPGAAKFVGTISEVGAKMSTLGSNVRQPCPAPMQTRRRNH